MEQNIKWVVAQPLIGGMPLGFEESFGCPPSYIITAGSSNDSHYINYMNVIRGLGIPIINMNSTFSTCDTPEDEALYNDAMENLDVFVSVPACAGLSQLNCCTDSCSTKRRGNPDNDQNQNMYGLNSLGMRMKAKVVVFENAPAAYTTAGEGVVNRLLEISGSFKYTQHIVKVDTLNHGIPQARKRTFITFFRDTNPPKFNYELIPYTPLVEYLEMVPKDATYRGVYMAKEPLDVFYEFVTTYHGTTSFLEIRNKLGITKETVSSISLTHKTGFDLALDYFQKKFDETQEDRYTRAIRIVNHMKAKEADGKGWFDTSTIYFNLGQYTNAVISKSIGSTLHPVETRALDIRELMHLMGLPHDFRFIDDNWKKFAHQITQNVPVKTARYIANQIKSYLNGELEIFDVPFVKQSNEKQRVDVPSGYKNPVEYKGPRLF